MPRHPWTRKFSVLIRRCVVGVWACELANQNGTAQKKTILVYIKQVEHVKIYARVYSDFSCIIFSFFVCFNFCRAFLACCYSKVQCPVGHRGALPSSIVSSTATFRTGRQEQQRNTTPCVKNARNSSTPPIHLTRGTVGTIPRCTRWREVRAQRDENTRCPPVQEGGLTILRLRAARDLPCWDLILVLLRPIKRAARLPVSAVLSTFSFNRESV